MKKVVVIGLGSFGVNLIRSLSKKKIELIAVDINKDRVNEIKDLVTQPVTMDATNRDNLNSLGLKDVDCVVVSCGPDLESSILIVHLLSEIGVIRVIAKALTEDHERILTLVGANEVLFPERDIARKLANQLISPNLMDYIPLESGFVIEELAPPDIFVGKTLEQIAIRTKFNINVIGIKQIIPDRASVENGTVSDSGLTLNPGGDFLIKESDILIVLGTNKDIEKLHDKLNNT
ncbi:MAG: TrkA family potassium uptake protein [Candidatus Aminicenantes bacterium]|nr:TrkA family potassium uptake protein [Candidatus Aminicenantes bacterium]